MGMTYTHHKMVGAFIHGQMKDMYLFLEKNGYSFTEQQKNDIHDNGQFNYDIIDILKLEDMDIINLNGWSGHDYVIGYHVSDESQTKKFAKKFAHYFPNVKATFHDFTEVS